jgi:hypothetical protein
MPVKSHLKEEVIRTNCGQRATPVTVQIEPIFSRNDSYIKTFYEKG